MPGVEIRYTPGPITYTVSDTVTGGQFVQADQSTSTANGVPTVEVATAGSVLWVGVALIDAAIPGTDSATDAAARPPATIVARAGSVVPVTFAASSVFGDRLKCAATGQVTPWVDGTDDPAEICGTNADPGGTVAEAAVGYVSIGA